MLGGFCFFSGFVIGWGFQGWWRIAVLAICENIYFFLVFEFLMSMSNVLLWINGYFLLEVVWNFWKGMELSSLQTFWIFRCLLGPIKFNVKLKFHIIFSYIKLAVWYEIEFRFNKYFIEIICFFYLNFNKKNNTYVVFLDIK